MGPKGPSAPTYGYLEAGRPLRHLTRVFALSLVSILLVLVPGGSVANSSFHPARSLGSLVLPIPPDQTWYVCQGYNGQITHQATPALDLSLDPGSPGPRGCMAGSKFSSAGSVASSPATGTAYRWPGCCGHDFVCINIDSGGSVAIGHLSNRIASGTRVEAGSRIGTVAWPGPPNGDYAHIHVQAHPSPDCTQGEDPVAFDAAHAFKWQCTPNLPYSGAANQYSGLAVNRCPSPGSTDRQASDTLSPRRSQAQDRQSEQRYGWSLPCLLSLLVTPTQPRVASLVILDACLGVLGQR